MVDGSIAAVVGFEALHDVAALGPTVVHALGLTAERHHLIALCSLFLSSNETGSKEVIRFESRWIPSDYYMGTRVGGRYRRPKQPSVSSVMRTVAALVDRISKTQPQNRKIRTNGAECNIMLTMKAFMLSSETVKYGRRETRFLEPCTRPALEGAAATDGALLVDARVRTARSLAAVAAGRAWKTEREAKATIFSRTSFGF